MSEEDVKLVVKPLKNWRQFENITVEDLAKSVDISVRTLRKYENDVNELRKTSYNTLEALARELNISISNIFLDDTSDKQK